MGKQIIFVFTISVLLVFYTGCSGSIADPISSHESRIQSDINASQTVTTLLGEWEMMFDFENNKVDVNPLRISNLHYNVTSLLPTPVIVVNGIDPVEQIVDADITISNPFAITGYDLRMIIYTDPAGHKLMNFDSWTDLYDIPGGLPINPFMAYAKSEVNRVFAGMTNHTENLLIKLPAMNPSVRFAIEASFPGNCREPYGIGNFTQGDLYDILGSNTEIEVYVNDWQDNVSNVYLYCPAIISGGLLTLNDLGTGALWGGTLVNETEADSGEYTGYIIAYSSDSGTQALYTEVIITVSHEHQPNDPQVVGECETYGAMGVEVFDDYAFIADGWGGLKVINIVFPESPSITGSYDTGGLVTDVAQWEGIYVYVTDGTNGDLVSFNIEAGGIPDFRDSYYTGGIASGISVDWPYGYVANGYNSTWIFDISDPENLDYLGAVPETDFSNHVDADGIWMIVADYEAGIQICNVDDREHPIVVDSVDTFRATGVEIDRPFVYVSDDSAGVVVVDIADPYYPLIATTVDTPGKAYRCVAQDNYLYVADGSNGLVIIDITEPYGAEIFSEIDPGVCNDVAVQNNFAYIANSSGLTIVQLW